MSRLFFIHLFLLLVVISGLKGQCPLSNKNTQLIINQLETVNELWSHKEIPLERLPQTLSNDDDLVQLHLRLVETALQEQMPIHLTQEQHKNRERVLNHLKDYWKRKQFPMNSFHDQIRQPYFVDLEGTHCAVGYLLKETGKKKLVEEIRTNHNYAYIPEMLTAYPELGEWAQNNGLSQEELRWIQPNYTFEPVDQEMKSLGNNGGTNGTVYSMEVSPDGSLLFIAGAFTEVDGHQANSIIAWDGEDWVHLDNGVEGVIYDMHIHNDRMHIAGNFKLFGSSEYSSIAYWNDTEWVPLQTGYTGDIYKMETYQGRLHIGGGFQYLNNEEMPHLAYYDELSGKWSNSSFVLEGGILVLHPGIFSVDDTVRSFIVYEDQLFVGGQFSMTSPYTTHPNVIKQEVQNFGRWYGHLWLPTAESKTAQIHHMEQIGDSICIFGAVDTLLPTYSFAEYYMDEEIDWFQMRLSFLDNGLPPFIDGFVQHHGALYYYGDVKTYGGMITIRGYGFAEYRGRRNGLFDGRVRAAASFQDNLYFGGDFTSAFEEPLAGLAYSDWQGIFVNTETDPEAEIHFYTAQKSLYLELGDYSMLSVLQIYSMSGQLLKTIEVRDQKVIDLSSFSNGIYAFHIRHPKFQQSKTLTLF